MKTGWIIEYIRDLPYTTIIDLVDIYTEFDNPKESNKGNTPQSIEEIKRLGFEFTSKKI